MDLDTLYMALHTVVGDEREYKNYDGACIRVLGLCYDLRHAAMGDREIDFVINGMDKERMKYMGRITSEQNVYYKFSAYYPELLFVTAALNDFIRHYAKKRAKSAPFPLLDKHNLWDAAIANVRLFQAEVVKCLKEMVPTEAAFSRMMNLMNKDYFWFDGYITQYIDMLNIRYLKMTTEERIKNLPTLVKRMMEQGKEYQATAREISEIARGNNCSVDDIRLIEEYPEDIVW